MAIIQKAHKRLKSICSATLFQQALAMGNGGGKGGDERGNLKRPTHTQQIIINSPTY